jgi:hypothetical protein
VETTEIIQQLEYFNNKYPREAMEAAIANPEAVTPGLLRMLEHTVNHMDEVAENSDYIGYLFAMYLLAQFREPRAFPYLVRLMSAPSDLLDSLLGDTYTDAGDRILASVYNGDLETLKALVVNRDADEFARSAALDAMRILVADGVLSREEVIAFLTTLFRGGLERSDNFIWYTAVYNVSRLYAETLFDDARELLAEKRFDPRLEDIDSFEEEIGRGKEATLEALYADEENRYITDAIKETSWWAMFHPERDRRMLAENLNMSPNFTPTTVVRSEPKVGRNDPCPCGSGLKYKKCHGKRSNQSNAV